MSESTIDIRIVPPPTSQDVLTDLLRDGARRMLAQAVEAEVAAYVAAHDHLVDDAGRRQVVRNGHLPERTIQTGLGDIEVKQPRVHDRRAPGEREKFTPAVLPPYLRRTRSLEELIAIADGYRESEQSWKELLLDCKARGLEIEPSLAIGDGALGFWKAMRRVWDTTKEQRCWVHKMANILDKLPRRSQPKAKRMLHDIYQA